MTTTTRVIRGHRRRFPDVAIAERQTAAGARITLTSGRWKRAEAQLHT